MKPDPYHLISQLDPIFHSLRMDKARCSEILITNHICQNPVGDTLYRLCASFCACDLIQHWNFWCLCFQGW